MTEVSIDAVLPSLEAHAARLNTASDRANNLLASLEKRLVALNIGLEFWCSRPIEVGDSDGDISPHKTRSKIVKFFGFARVEGKWCLAVKPIRIVEGFYQGDMECPYKEELGAGPTVPLLKEARALRISALQAMPDFLCELNKHVLATVQEIEATAGKLAPE